MYPLTAALLCLTASSLAAQDPDAARVDRDAALRHYAAVEAELRAAPLPQDPSVAARRLCVIESLRAYRERGDLGVNAAYAGSRVPLFVDDEGRRCAVAWLLDRTGYSELTLAIHRRCNQAWLAELVQDEPLGQWLAHHGITPAEATRIQMPGTQQVPAPTQLPAEQPDLPASTPSGAPSGSGTLNTRPSLAATSGTATSTAPTARGTPIEATQTASWLQWWEWNRGAFETPQRSHTATASPTAVDPRRQDAEVLLGKLAGSPDIAVRSAAVQALGRIGASAPLEPFLADSAREVRLMALLGLGRSGNAAQAYLLATRAMEPQPGETLAVVLAGMSMLEGTVQRTLASTITQRLLDPRPSVHTAAAIAASADASISHREVARDALHKAATELQRAEAAQLLGPGATADDVATLTALASDRSVDVRRSAALALGRSKHALALPALQSAYELEHENLTRSLQLLAIGDHGGDAGRAFLTAELEQGSKPQRAHAALALGLWGRDRDFGDVAARIESALANEKNRDQKGAYLLALGLLRHAPARDLLANELREGANSSVRGAAACALGLLGDRASVPAMTAALVGDSCPWVREQVARALHALGSDAIKALVAAMHDDKDAGVQRAAAFSLGGIADTRAATALLAFAADDSRPAVARAGAAMGLGRHFRKYESRLPSLRFQHNHLQLPAITAWAFAQEL